MEKNTLPSTWVVVADNSKAKIFRLVKFPNKIEEITQLVHPASRLHNQDLISSKPGRSFQSGGTTRHAYQPETEPKQVEAIKFAREVVQYLSTAEKKGEFSRLYLIAEPSFLGLLRQLIHPEMQKLITNEIAKELTSCDISTVEALLSKL